jgi:hypothetical protein
LNPKKLAKTEDWICVKREEIDNDLVVEKPKAGNKKKIYFGERIN